MKEFLNYEAPELDVDELLKNDAIVMSGDEFNEDDFEEPEWYRS